jgi:hypothetical protein
MTKLESDIAQAVRTDRWAVSVHARQRLHERDVELWQVIDGFADGQTVSVRADDKPNPKMLRRQQLASGEFVVVVWAFERFLRIAQLVTVYFED